MKKHKDYFMLPNKIFDLELKPRDFIVYSCLVRHKDNETHTCYPSRKLIAKECCITLRTVDKALASLQNLILVFQFFHQPIIPHKGNSKTYNNLAIILLKCIRQGRY